MVMMMMMMMMMMMTMNVDRFPSLKRLHKLSPPYPIWVECLLPCGVQLPLESMFSLLYKWSCIVAPSGGGMEQK